MELPVTTPAFWKERIERASKEGREHYSVYLARQTLWDAIGEAHKKILARECVGYKTLDAGCGYGRASEWVEDYTGVDISPDFIQLAQQKYPTRTFILADLVRLPFADNHFDVAFCISIKNMVVGNLGEGAWEPMEEELKRVANRVLLLEYEEAELYTIL